MSLVDTLRFVASHPLNANRRLNAMVRFARWQLASRLMEGEFVFAWVNDAKFKVRRGQTGLTGNIYTGLHEFEDMGFLLHYLRPQDIFLDVGANVGSYTVLAAAAVGAECVSMEPVPATYMHLLENVRLNGKDSRVRCLNIAAGNQSGTILFTADGDTVNHVVTAGELTRATVQVPIQEIDAVLGVDVPRLVKIDVEGYETPAMQGAAHTLAGSDARAVIMELNGSGSRYGFDESVILQQMLDWGYRPYSYQPFSRQLVELSSKSASAGNTLFIRNEDFARERVQSARRYRVLGHDL
jgi:FkbM family methyltransferase